jgi:TP901 family phage tail tape measure protein
MANLGNMFVNIGARTTQLKAGLASAQRQVTSFAGKTSGALTSLTKNFGALGTAAIAAGAAFGTLSVIKGTLNEFVTFENALLDLKKVLNDSEGDVNQYIGQVDELSDRFATSAAEVLQGAANFKQAGFTVQEAFKLQETALTAFRISELSVIESSELLISILKGFDSPVSDATRILDGLNEVSNKYATSLGELGKGMAEIAPIAKEMGFTYAEVAGLLTPVIEVFRSGTEAGNALKISFLNLTSSQAPVLEGLARLGVSQRKANGEMKTGKQIVLEVQEAWSGLSAAQKPVIAALLAGKRQAARFSVAIRDMGKSAQIASDFNRGLGSATKELDIRMASTEVRIQRMGKAYQNLKRDIGGELAPAVVDLSKQMTELLKTMRETGTIDAFGKALGALVTGTANLATNIVRITKLFNIKQDAIALLNEKSNEFVRHSDLSAEAIDSLNKRLKDEGFNIHIENMKEAIQATKLLKSVSDDLYRRKFPDLGGERLAGPVRPFVGPQLPEIGTDGIASTKSGFKELTEQIESDARKWELATQTPLEKMKEDMAEIIRLAKSGDISQKTAADSFNLIGERYQEQTKNVNSANEALIESAKRTALAVRSPLEVMNDAIKQLNAERAAAPEILNQQKYDRAYAEIVASYENSIQKMKRATSIGANEVAQIWLTEVGRNMDQLAGTLGDVVFAAWSGDMQNFQEKLKNFMDSLKQTIANTMREIAQEKLFKPFINAVVGNFGGSILGGGAGGALGSGALGLLGSGFGIVKSFFGFHDGGIVGNTIQTMHDGGIKADERLAKLQVGEGVLSRKDMKNIGGVIGFNNLRSGNDGMTINVPVNVEGGNNRLAGELQRNIEQTVIKTIKEFA